MPLLFPNVGSHGFVIPAILHYVEFVFVFKEFLRLNTVYPVS